MVLFRKIDVFIDVYIVRYFGLICGLFKNDMYFFFCRGMERV